MRAHGQPANRTKRSGGVLAQLVEELNALRYSRRGPHHDIWGPETPVIDLPPIFAPSPGLTLDRDLALRCPCGSAWYLEHPDPGRTYGHALRRADPLGHGQRSTRGMRPDTIAHAQIHRPRLRHRCDGGCAGQPRLPANARACPVLGDGAWTYPRRGMGACCAPDGAPRYDREENFST